LVSTCSYQCSAGACVAPPPASGSISITPSLVASGGTVTISWNISNVDGSCTISDTNGDRWSSSANASNVAAGSMTSPQILKQITFTISCKGLDSVQFQQSATVNTIPGFREL
ncbi:MAG TPA: hypothetical protein VN495_03755, partial [Candidatus Paceibacterota bacterium]|nr:hypothetical protein [Candidatus Paceibacterota bacterium]